MSLVPSCFFQIPFLYEVGNCRHFLFCMIFFLALERKSLEQWYLKPERLFWVLKHHRTSTHTCHSSSPIFPQSSPTSWPTWRIWETMIREAEVSENSSWDRSSFWWLSGIRLSAYSTGTILGSVQFPVSRESIA